MIHFTYKHLPSGTIINSPHIKSLKIVHSRRQTMIHSHILPALNCAFTSYSQRHHVITIFITLKIVKHSLAYPLTDKNLIESPIYFREYKSSIFLHFLKICLENFWKYNFFKFYWKISKINEVIKLWRSDLQIDVQKFKFIGQKKLNSYDLEILTYLNINRNI